MNWITCVNDHDLFLVNVNVFFCRALIAPIPLPVTRPPTSISELSEEDIPKSKKEIPRLTSTAKGKKVEEIEIPPLPITTAGQNLDTIRYHIGFLGQRIGPVSTLSFHPHKLLLGAGFTDSSLSVWTSALSR